MLIQVYVHTDVELRILFSITSKNGGDSGYYRQSSPTIVFGSMYQFISSADSTLIPLRSLVLKSQPPPPLRPYLSA